jgi:hypothetical protein
MTAMNRFPLLVALTAVSMAVGCEPAAPPVTPDPAPAAAPADDHGHVHEEGHEHGAGPHGGTLADWGGGKYHIEFTVDHEKQQATVYVLGSDEKTPTPIQPAEGKLLLTITDPAIQLDLLPQSLAGETDGKASCYVGQHEKLKVAKDYSGTISGEVDGTPYAGDFQEEAHGHDQK